MKELAERFVKMAIFPYRMHPTTSIHRSLFDKSGDVNVHNP